MAFSDISFGSSFFIVAVLIIAVWVVIEIRRFKHKIFAMFLIALILFLYISGLGVFGGANVDLSSVSGIIDAWKIYFSWLGSAFGNMKTLTANALNLDWS